MAWAYWQHREMVAPNSRNPKSQRPPPARNYLSRREQLRLLLLVGTLMLILVAMFEARKPERWFWLTGRPGAAEDPAIAGDPTEQLDTHLQRTRTAGVLDMPGAIVVSAPGWKPADALDDEARARRNAEKDFWHKQLDALPWEQRRLVATVLKSVRDDAALSPAQQELWQATTAALDANWESSITQATDTVTVNRELSDEDRATWLLILHDLERDWHDALHDALVAAGQPKSLTAAQREEVMRFMQLYDEMGLEAIRDDTLLSRPAEIDAWFRLLENLQDAPADEFDAADVQLVGFRQLFKQPEEYRGRLVRVRGEVLDAYPIGAPRNNLGIERYHVFVMIPAGGPASPLMVYALEVPENFPVPAHTGALRPEKPLIREPVEVTGYFYKRYAYQGHPDAQGVKETWVAPLILARRPNWTPKADDTFQLPDWRLFALAVLGAAALGVGVAVWVFRQGSTPGVEDYSPAARVRGSDLKSLGDAPIAPSTVESLNELSQSQSDGESPPPEEHP
ncbi:MAG: hypothetical protein KDA41_12380 [Planctomycetales bacterium]|nr:hypothetical protein [Planctomycetales bacterium]